MTGVGNFTVQVHLRKVTNDPDFPYPWKWNLETDTPYGHLTDEGLCATEQDCPVQAKQHILKWISDRQVALATHAIVQIEIEDE